MTDKLIYINKAIEEQLWLWQFKNTALVNQLRPVFNNLPMIITKHHKDRFQLSPEN